MVVKVICVLILGFAGVWGRSGYLKDLPSITSNGNQLQEVPQKRNSGYHYGSSPNSHDEYLEGLKNNQPSPGFHYDNNNPYKYEPYTDGYKKSWKTLRTEKFETETIDNPHSDNPENKYIVKGTYKIREKLPLEDHTIGYDQNYEYPISDIDHQYDQNEKIVDYNNAKTDPFSHGDYQVPKEYPKQKKVSKDYDYGYDFPKQKQKKPKKYHYYNETPPKQEKKPKQLTYQYKYPSTDYEYHKNVHLVDFYLNKNNPGELGALHEEPKGKAHGFNDVDYGVSKAEKYSDRLGPSDEESYHNYKADGPSFEKYF